MSSGKQPAGLKLTSGSGEQAFHEVPLLASRGKKNLYLIDTVGNYIMGFTKPIERLSRCEGITPKGTSFLFQKKNKEQLLTL
jgi:hypothetical protein